MPVFLRLWGLWRSSKAQARGLLRLLLLRHGSMPASSGSSCTGGHDGHLLRMTQDGTATCAQNDWVNNRRAYTLAWGLPTAGLIAGIFLAAPLKTAIWSAALVWMGTACLVNARRCRRRHCYLTGPFFLVMAVLVLSHGIGIVPLGNNGFLWLGVALVVGGYGLLWKLPEYLWGTYVRSSWRRRS